RRRRPRTASERRERILNDPPKRLVIFMGLPLLISFFIGTLFNLVDTWFVSMLPGDAGADGVAGIGNAFAIQLVLIAIGSGIGQGAASTVARRLGANDTAGAQRAGAQIVLLTLGLTAAFMLLGAIVKPMMTMIGANDAIIDASIVYGEYVLIGCVGWFVPMIMGGILRGVGDMIGPMLAMLAAIVLNIILDPILIFGLGPIPAMGVRGAAAATVIARWASALLIVWFLLGKRNALGRAIFTRLRPDSALLKDILRVGIPTSIGTILGAGYMLIVQIFVGHHVAGGGPAAQAAFTIGFRFEQLAWLPVHGVAIALTTIVGQNHGAGRFDREREAMKWCLIWTTGIISVFSLLYLIGAPWMAAALAGGDPDTSATVADIATVYIRVIAVELPLLAAAMTIGSTFNGRGRGWPYFSLQVLRLFALSIPLFIVFAPTGIYTFWWAMPLASGAAVALGALWLRRELRRDPMPPLAKPVAE
ncbi:MAG: MATE family efflux transporter, partial [Planctomycetota bacterium]